MRPRNPRPDFGALNRAAAAEMALRQIENGRVSEASIDRLRKVIDGVPHQMCLEHGWVVGCNHLTALDYREEREERHERHERDVARAVMLGIDWPGLRRSTPRVRRFQCWSPRWHRMLRNANWYVATLTILGPPVLMLVSGDPLAQPAAMFAGAGIAVAGAVRSAITWVWYSD